MKRFVFLWAVAFVCGSVVQAQQITSVEVVSVGVAQSEEDATTKALVRAISQVNGEAIALKTKLTTETNESVKIPTATPAAPTANINFFNHWFRVNYEMAANAIDTCNKVVPCAQRWCMCIWNSESWSHCLDSASNFSACALMSFFSFL